MVINSDNARIGFITVYDMTIPIVDTEKSIALYSNQRRYSSINFAVLIFQFLAQYGINPYDYLGQFGYHGFDSDFIDFLSVSGVIHNLDDVVMVMPSDFFDSMYMFSIDLFPSFNAMLIKSKGDSRSFDEIVADVSADMESKIQWQSNTPFYIIAPRVNKDGVINLFRVLANAMQSASYSARPINLFRR